MLAGVLVLGIGASVLGERVAAVRLELLEGADEGGDASLLGLRDSSPDYRLELLVGENLFTVDAPSNQAIGAGLELPIEERIWRADLRGLRLLERDRLADDELDQVELEGDVAEGERFRFTVLTRTDLLLGFERSLGTPWGLFAAFVIVLGLSITAFSRLKVGWAPAYRR